MYRKIINPQKYYKRLVRNTRILHWLYLIVVLGILCFGILAIMEVAGQTTGIGWLNSLSSITDTWQKWTVGASIVGFLKFFIISFWRRRKFFVFLKRTVRSWAGVYPTGITIFLKHHYSRLCLRRNNAFWLWVFPVGLSFLTMLYCAIVGLATGTGVVSGTYNDINAITFFSALGTFWALTFWIFISQRVKAGRIQRVWTICGEENPEMHNWHNNIVQPKLARNNKRNKIIVFAILAFLGTIFFFFFKRLVITVYRTEINNHNSTSIARTPSTTMTQGI